MIFSDDFSVSPTAIICSNWFPAHLKRVLIFLAEVLVCDEVRQMVAPGAVVVVGHTPLIWRGSQAKPISSCPHTST